MRTQISDEMMEAVNGGLSYDSENMTLGFCSSSSKPYRYKNEAAVGASVIRHMRDRTFTDGDDCDAYLIECLLAEDLIWEIK